MKKGWKFEWGEEHTKAMWRLKGTMVVALALRKAVYGKDSPIYVTIDTSPTVIGWVVNHDDEAEMRFAI